MKFSISGQVRFFDGQNQLDSLLVFLLSNDECFKLAVLVRRSISSWASASRLLGCIAITRLHRDYSASVLRTQ